MRKYTPAGLTLILATVLAAATSVSAQVQVGTVDLQRVRSESPEFKRVLGEIDAMVEEFETRRDRQQSELEGLSEDLRDAQERGLTGSAERLQNELQEKSVAFQTFMEETFGTDGIVETNSAEQLTPLYNKLAEACKAVAKREGLDLILDLETVNPLFADERLDVTDDVLEAFAKLR
jgi:Skp family chaperone for outer membrane proteins